MSRKVIPCIVEWLLHDLLDGGWNAKAWQKEKWEEAYVPAGEAVAVEVGGNNSHRSGWGRWLVKRLEKVTTEVLVQWARLRPKEASFLGKFPPTPPQIS